MGKQLYHLLMFALIFTLLFLTYNCTKDNEPPNTPLLYFPVDNDTDISTLPTLIWSACPDPENDQVSYDIYLGQTNPPPLVKSDQPLNNFHTDTLIGYTTYYWKVVAKDGNKGSTSSVVCCFRTGNPVIKPGNLKVLVCYTFLTYWGGAEVFLYLTESARTNDPQRTSYYQKATTDNTDPANIGAVFYALTFQKCYVYARLDKGGGQFITGVGESFIQSGKTTTLIVKMQ
jgi:hypothetical protein